MNMHSLLFKAIGVLMIIYCVYVLLVLVYEVFKEFLKGKRE